jgi:16S rRNA processing protein RimM
VSALDADAFSTGAEVRLEPQRAAQAEQSFRILESRRHNHLLVVRLSTVEDIDTARGLVGSNVLVRRADLRTLPTKTFRAADLIGFDVKDKTLGSLGKVSGVRHYPACDMLVVGQANTLVPMLAAYAVTVHKKKREIVVSLPPGFEEL